MLLYLNTHFTYAHPTALLITAVFSFIPVYLMRALVQATVLMYVETSINSM